MKVGLITYRTRHLKTAQVALNLAQQPIEISFFALPFQPRAQRNVQFPHRPDQSFGPETSDLARFLGAPFHDVENTASIPDDFDHYVITGASLLPPAFVRRTEGRVLNAHPGIIPIVRGLDSFKWAILDGAPLGNSLHFIDAEADAGQVVHIRSTPVFRTDTLADLAARHYELEIDLLSRFRDYLSGPSLEARTQADRSPARLRMPRELELQLEPAFEIYKQRWAV